MHELPVTQSLLKIALDHAEKANARQVTALNIVIGELSSMVDDSIQFYWETIAKDTIAEKATLHFRRVPAELQCMTCFNKYHPKDGELICPLLCTSDEFDAAPPLLARIRAEGRSVF